MVDNTNPTNQFHPYQPTDFQPVKDAPVSGMQSMLGKIGINTDRLGDTLKGVASNESVIKARSFARSNGAIVLGGLALAAIGVGLFRKRS